VITKDLVYNLRMIYGILTTIIFWIFFPILLIGSLVKKKSIYGLKEKLGFFKFNPQKEKSIIFYGVSVGETQALEKLVKDTKKEFPEYNLVVVTGTKTGQELAKKKYGEICDLVTYFPYDIPCCVYRFLKKTNPAAVLIVETEMWPNFINMTTLKKIPLYIINGRISDRTYKSYKKLSFVFKPLLRKYTKVLTQSKMDNEKLISIGSNPETTNVMGNIKFDLTIPKSTPELKTNGRIIIAGSTHKGEDEIILEAYSEVKKEIPDIKLLIAPRHPERNDAVYEMIKKLPYSSGKKSNSDDFTEKEIILLDTMGELSSLYAICDFAVICGSFNKTGGHNPLECVIYNKPVISGSNVRNFRDIYGIITSTDAGKIVANKEELIAQMKKLLTDKTYYNNACEDCKKVFLENMGGTQKVIDEIKNILHHRD